MTPIAKSLSSHIKDRNHALDIFRTFNFSGENKFIFTMDITSLYTVIPNNEGLRALKYFLNQRPVEKPNSETFLRLAELVLPLNCFSFGNSYYNKSTVLQLEPKRDLATQTWSITHTNQSTLKLMVGHIVSCEHNTLRWSSHPNITFSIFICNQSNSDFFSRWEGIMFSRESS